MNADAKYIIRETAGPLIGGAVLLLILYFIYRKITASGKDQRELTNEVKENRLTYPKSQYQTFADTLEIAFSGFWGDDEDAIYNVFEQMKTNSDVLQLQIAWGKRTFINSRGLYYSASLAEVISGELDKKEIAKINQILSDRNINIKFT